MSVVPREQILNRRRRRAGTNPHRRSTRPALKLIVMPTADDFENASRLLEAVSSECSSAMDRVGNTAQLIVLAGGSTATSISENMRALIDDLNILAREVTSLRIECDRRARECRAFDATLVQWRQQHLAWMREGHGASGAALAPPEPTRPTPPAAWIEPSRL